MLFPGAVSSGDLRKVMAMGVDFVGQAGLSDEDFGFVVVNSFSRRYAPCSGRRRGKAVVESSFARTPPAANGTDDEKSTSSGGL